MGDGEGVRRASRREVPRRGEDPRVMPYFDAALDDTICSPFSCLLGWGRAELADLFRFELAEVPIVAES